MTATQPIKLPEGWVLESGRAGYLARHIGSNVTTLPQPRKHEAIAAAIHLDTTANDPKTAALSTTTSAIAAAKQTQGAAPSVTEPLPLDHLFARTGPERQELTTGAIEPGRYQPRHTFDDSTIAELADSIREHGVLTPIQVIHNERGQFELVAGERRLRAAKLVGLTTIPADVKAYTLQQVMEISLIDNLQREQLSDIDEGQAFNRLINELGISENALAKRLGKNRAYIQQRRAIANAIPELHAALSSGTLTLSQARAVATAAPDDPKSQAKALKEIQKQIGYGTRINEAHARAITEAAVRGRVKQDLERLGWQVKDQVVWSASERPRQWTGAEMLDAVRTATRPAGTAIAAGTISNDHASLLKHRYWIESRAYAPWICLSPSSYEQESARFVSADELPQIVHDLNQDIGDVQARFGAHGWTLTTGEHSYFHARSTEGAERSCWRWDEAVKLIEQIEAGKVTAQPQPVTSPQPQRCDGCKKKSREVRWHRGRELCPTCVKTAEEADRQRKAAITAKIAAVAGSLDSLDDDLLRLMVAAMSPMWRHKIIELTSAELRAAVIEAIATHADRTRDEPVAPSLQVVDLPATTPRHPVAAPVAALEEKAGGA